MIAQPVRVMIVDDDPWTTTALAHTLDPDPEISVVGIAHSGDRALELAPRVAPQLVLMDITMPPGMSGIEAIAQLRLLLPEVRVVVLTTLAPGPGIARALEAGALAVCSKGAPPGELRACITRLARGEDPRALRRLAQDIVISGDPLPGAPAVAPRLARRELEVLTLVCEGRGYEEIAHRLGISVWTARSHTKNLRDKLVADNLAQLVVRALQFRFYAP